MSAAWTTLIDAAALARLVERDAVLVCDCRVDLADRTAGMTAFRAAHVPGAIYCDLETDLSGEPTGRNGRHPLPDRAAFAARMAALGISHDTQVVAYDDAGGAYAARLWWMLRWIGHDAVAVLDGGWQAWTDAGLPVEAGDARARVAGDLTAGAAPGEPTVTADEILAGGDRLVIDARTPDRFGGAPHPLDARPGHIPGARNRFYCDNLGADGRFKPREVLRREFAGVIGDTPIARVVLQCGSGVTAAHNLLAMAHAGLDGAALYPGSWSEWTSDPARPIALD